MRMKKKESGIGLNKEVVIYGLILIFSVVTFGYRLGWGSLEPWDEAWFADVARNVLRGHVLYLQAFKAPFIDHPPLGFWVMALFIRILGLSEFSIRLGSALLGVLSMFLLYASGKKLKNRWIGVGAVVVALSSRWYLLRVRSGNLDSLLALTQLLVFYLSLTAQTKKELLWGFLALGAGLLTKTVIAVSLLPLLIYRAYVLWKKKLVTCTWIGLCLFLAFGPISLWYGLLWKKYGGDTLSRMLQNVVFRGDTSIGLNLNDWKRTILLWQPLFHRWFKPLLVSLGLGVLMSKRNKIGWVYAYFILIALPFFISSHEKIWHVVTLTIPGALLISFFGFEAIELLLRTARHKGWILQGRILVLVGLVVVAGWSWKEIYPEIIRDKNSVSDQEYLGNLIENVPGVLVLDVFYDIYPTAGFYADKPLRIIKSKKVDWRGASIERPFVVYTDGDGGDCEQVAVRNNYRAYYCR